MRPIKRRETKVGPLLLTIRFKLIFFFLQYQILCLFVVLLLQRYLVKVQQRVLLIILLILIKCLQYFDFLFGVILHSNYLLSVVFLYIFDVRLVLQQRVQHAIIYLSLMRNHPASNDNQLVKVRGRSH